MARGDPETPVEESWQRARLIPTTGIRGVKDREQRATSALLAVIGAVPDFGKAILARVGAPAGRISTFVEPQFRDAADDVHIPDGAVVVERGKSVWRALIEVKTGHSELEAEQVNRYLDIARQHDFDAVLTISNQIVSSSEESPADVDRRRLRNVDLRHVSWSRIFTAAIVQREHRGVSDPEQAWILGELITYLDDEASGAAGFEDMGQSWVSVRDGARELKLHPSEDSVRDIAARWDQFVQFLCLGLRQELGRDVKPVVPRKSDPAERLSASAKTLAETGMLRATINVPDTAGPMTIEPDMRARLTTTSVRVAAPRDDSRPKTKVNWLLRQLRDAADDLLVSVRFANTKETVSRSLGEARKDAAVLFSPTDPKRVPRDMTVSLTRDMGLKRGRGPGSFVHATRQQTLDFYREVVQTLQEWTPKAPKLREEPEPEPTEEVGQPVEPPHAPKAGGQDGNHEGTEHLIVVDGDPPSP